MGFAAPLGLLALLSIAMPVLIDLRRKPAHPVRVGSIRHLAGAAPRPRAGARVSELLLLLLRIALLALVAAAVAEPFLENAVAPPRARQVAITADSMRDVWSLLRELDDSLPAGSSIDLSVPGRVTVSGSRPAVASRVTIRERLSGAGVASGGGGKRREVLLVAPPSRAEAVRYLSAAFEAVAWTRGDTLTVAELPPASRGDSMTGRWVIWLADSGRRRADALAEAGAMVLTESPQRAHRGVPVGPGLFVRRAGAGVVYELDGRFDPNETAMVAAGGLPGLIAAIWPGDVVDRPARITASQLQPAERPPERGDARAPLAMPIAAVAAVVFLAERVLAHRGLRSRRSPA